MPHGKLSSKVYGLRALVAVVFLGVESLNPKHLNPKPLNP